MPQLTVQTSSVSPGAPSTGSNLLYTLAADHLPHWIDDGGVDLTINLGTKRSVPSGYTYTIGTDVSVVVTGYYNVIGTLTILNDGALEIH